jgi:sucrose-phosphate synthase
MDRYDLYGQMAIPKRHDYATEVPELYRLVARSQGVFVNPALTEPFGLTLIEAAASGLPVVATNDGGPRDIMANCEHGRLVDPRDTDAIAAACQEIIGDPVLWQQLSNAGITGVDTHYTWEAHTRKYKDAIGKIGAVPRHSIARAPKDSAIGRRLQMARRILVTDIDDTLLGGDAALDRFLAFYKKHRKELVFGVATGRTIESTQKTFQKYGIPMPDFAITSVGAEFYLGEVIECDKGWERHISHRWNRDEIIKLLKGAKALTLQEAATQRPYKLSYYVDSKRFRRADLERRLSKCKSRYTLIISGNGMFLDFLPYRASKGQAVRYFAFKWNIPLGHILVAGDSDSDREMLRGRMPAVVVANHKPELNDLKRPRRPSLFFSTENHADGILDGLRHYGFFPEAHFRRAFRSAAH